VIEMLYNMVKPQDAADSDSEDDDESMKQLENMYNQHKASTKASNLQKKGDIMRTKVKFLSKMLKMNKTLR
jgi:predicted DNA binding CopG/RHH family protein